MFLVMEKVVVVVVVMMCEGFLGFGIWFDWENLRDLRLLMVFLDMKV